VSRAKQNPNRPRAEGGARLWVRVRPRSSGDRILGWSADGFLDVQLKAAPERGEANRAAGREIARALGVAAERVVLEKGHAGRLKAFRLVGLAESDVRTRLGEAAVAGPPACRRGLCK